jgi:hypothetical protein
VPCGSFWVSSKQACFLVGNTPLGLDTFLTFSGCIYLISMYYKRYELQWRLTLFFTASIIAGAFSGVRIPLPLDLTTVLMERSSWPSPSLKWTASLDTVDGGKLLPIHSDVTTNSLSKMDLHNRRRRNCRLRHRHQILDNRLARNRRFPQRLRTCPPDRSPKRRHRRRPNGPPRQARRKTHLLRSQNLLGDCCILW